MGDENTVFNALSLRCNNYNLHYPVGFKTRIMKTVNFVQRSSAPLKSIEAPKQKILIATSKENFIVSKSDILYLKSDSNYCEIFLTDGRKILSSQTLKTIFGKINSPRFYRPHNSFVINVDFLSSVSASFNELTLLSNINIPISRSNKSELKIKLEHWYD